MVYKSGQIFLPFCHNPRVWRTDGQTDRIIIARRRLHSMQRGKINSIRLLETNLGRWRCRIAPEWRHFDHVTYWLTRANFLDAVGSTSSVAPRRRRWKSFEVLHRPTTARPLCPTTWPYETSAEQWLWRRTWATAKRDDIRQKICQAGWT